MSINRFFIRPVSIIIIMVILARSFASISRNKDNFLQAFSHFQSFCTSKTITTTTTSTINNKMGNAVSNDKTTISPITANQILQQQNNGINQVVYLDVRMPQEFQNGHVPGAINVPVTLGGGVIVPTFLDDVKSAIPEDVKLIVGCKSGKRSTMAIQVLNKHPTFEGRISELQGGFDAWLASSDLPIER